MLMPARKITYGRAAYKVLQEDIKPVVSIFDHIDIHGEEADFIPKIPEYCTSTNPGSKERIEVYIERLNRGEDLWHPGDKQAVATAEQSNEMAAWVKANSKGSSRVGAAERIVPPGYVTMIDLSRSTGAAMSRLGAIRQELNQYSIWVCLRRYYHLESIKTNLAHLVYARQTWKKKSV